MTTTSGFDTVAVHAGDDPDAASGALEPPVVLSNAFAFDDAEDAAARFAPGADGFVYSRWRNPTVVACERKLAALEGAEDCAMFASGMAAVHAATFANLEAGGEVVATGGLYAETHRLLRGPHAQLGVRHTLVVGADLAAFERAITKRTSLVYIETPANPTLSLVDIEAVARLERGCPLVVDSTFATPYHQRPLAHGADLVVHSATKSLGGHGDAVGGAVVGSKERIAKVRAFGVRSCGAALSPMNAMLIARGMRTLGLRMERASASAMTLATRLEAHENVARVHYPGLASSPDHALATRQMTRGFGALIAFELEGGRDAGARCYDRVQTIARAVSLGDVRSLLTHPASTTHASLTREERAAASIGEGMLRLSVGIEDADDLWRDLEQALS
ncbi:MAG: PLP-dependent aspartate aminotransferase family protein [Sandaracinaceae bacterium]